MTRAIPFAPLALLVALAPPSEAWAQSLAPSQPGWLDVQVPPKTEATEANLTAGRGVYEFRCAGCHGVKGDAQGPAAKYLDPRPRDFTLANFKMRTTVFGELPRDEDLFRTITRGVPGTAMPSWVTLPADERWNVIHYIKKFATDFFEDPDSDPTREEDGETFLVDVPPTPPPATPELIAAGKEVFSRGKCIECHGLQARGDGTSAGTQFTALRHRVLPRNVYKTWRYKGGSTVRDIWRTLTAGINGTPMPSMIGSLDDKDPEKDKADRWAVAHYVASLTQALPAPGAGGTVLAVRKVASLPEGPDDDAWDGAHELAFRMYGQVTRRPRWQTPAVDYMQIRALHDGTDIAFRLVWDDRTESRKHEGDEMFDEDTTYPVLDVDVYEHKRVTWRDAVAIQFPAKSSGDATRPYFLYGQSDRPVNLWRWLADEDAVAELDAKGAGATRTKRRADSRVASASTFDKGQWRVQLRRPLAPAEGRKDVDLSPGPYVPFLLMAWDGGAGESGLRQSLSSWYTLKLEAPIPRRAYAMGLFGMLAILLLELELVRRARSKPEEGPAA